MPQLIRLTGIEAQGRHGARAGERDVAQAFVVDLEVVVEATDDDLDSTADYREVIRAARGVIEAESHALIETLATRIAAAVADVAGVLSCRATVHKPGAAGRLGATDISAETTAGRLGR